MPHPNTTYKVIYPNVWGGDVERAMIQHDDTYHKGNHTALVDVDQGPASTQGFYTRRYNIICPKCKA